MAKIINNAVGSDDFYSFKWKRELDLGGEIGIEMEFMVDDQKIRDFEIEDFDAGFPIPVDVYKTKFSKLKNLSIGAIGLANQPLGALKLVRNSEGVYLWEVLVRLDYTHPEEGDGLLWVWVYFNEHFTTVASSLVMFGFEDEADVEMLTAPVFGWEDDVKKVVRDNQIFGIKK